ncbi:MAG: protein kinase [Proteobacteria bacterium]|nr:protein kinase [Pseudomonadota bacterium]
MNHPNIVTLYDVDREDGHFFITKERNLKIMDFGLAKILEAVCDKGAALIAGTPFHMAPEPAAGNVADGRTDLYALGVKLFELSTGTTPFSEGDETGHHRETPPPDAADRVDDYPRALADLIRHLMAKKPEQRPESATVVAEMLANN